MAEKGFRKYLPVTFLIGAGFFTMGLMDPLYDSYVTIFLSKYIPYKSIVGILMSLDNIFAIFLIPLVSAWSDKTRTPIGRRMPWIALLLPHILGDLVEAQRLEDDAIHLAREFLIKAFGDGYNLAIRQLFAITHANLFQLRNHFPFHQKGTHHHGTKIIPLATFIRTYPFIPIMDRRQRRQRGGGG